MKKNPPQVPDPHGPDILPGLQEHHERHQAAARIADEVLEAYDWLWVGDFCEDVGHRELDPLVLFKLIERVMKRGRSSTAAAGGLAKAKKKFEEPKKAVLKAWADNAAQGYPVTKTSFSDAWSLTLEQDYKLKVSPERIAKKWLPLMQKGAC